MRRRVAGLLALGLAASPLALTSPASAATATCSTSTTDRPTAGTANAGTAMGRGLFLTYSDGDTILQGGTLVPPDISSPLAQVSVDRTGLGSALGSPFYSPYSDAAGVLNAFGGTELPLDGLSQPSRAKVSGRPPQQQAIQMGGACAKLDDGPLAEAAANAGSFGHGLDVRFGEVHATTGPKGMGSKALSTVVMTDITIGALRIEQIILNATAVADGKDGEAFVSSVVNGVTVAGQPYVWDEGGLDPFDVPPPDTEALQAAGIELISAGSTTHSASGAESSAVATGPVLKITTPDGRTLTVVLGQAQASAEHADIS